MIDRGHWTEGITPNPKKYFGFIYIITDETTGRAYIGKKQFYMAKSGAKGCKSRIANRSHTRWKPECWKESDWRTYSGSSKSFTKWMKENPKHKYTYKIIRHAKSRGDLTYYELKELWKRNVLVTKLPDKSDYVYFNRQIGAIKYRPTL